MENMHCRVQSKCVSPISRGALALIIISQLLHNCPVSTNCFWFYAQLRLRLPIAIDRGKTNKNFIEYLDAFALNKQCERVGVRWISSLWL